MDVYLSTVSDVIGWYPEWINLDPSGNPANLTAAAVYQPPQLKLTFTFIIPGVDKRDKITAYIAPDSGSSIEFFYFFTWLHFQDNYLQQLPEVLRTDGPRLFAAFARVFQGSAKIVWTEVLSDNDVDVAMPHDAATNDLSHTSFTSCVVKYPEKRAGFENIGDYVCHKLLNSKKPASMSAD
jgi:hypothetical protein